MEIETHLQGELGFSHDCLHLAQTLLGTLAFIVKCELLISPFHSINDLQLDFP